jgi:glucose/mannose-6-phosphate isomerase
MNLDDLPGMMQLDTSKYYDEILKLPKHISSGWKIGKSHAGLMMDVHIDRVIICGMGGSAIGADLAASYAREQCLVPILINREYDLPGWASGRTTLVIASSHSGNTEETLSCFRQALARNCSLLAVSTGGELEIQANSNGVTHWKFDHKGQPRAAVGFSLGLMLAALFHHGLIQDPTTELDKALELIRKELQQFTAEVLVAKNPAKRLAGQLVGRIPVIFASDALAPVARRFKTQVNELAKGWAEFDLLPEADHNTAAGIAQPETAGQVLFGLFLESASDHPRNRLRSAVTRQNFLLEGIVCDNYVVPGETRLENIVAGIQFCDFTTFYLAIAYGEDPTPIPGIIAIKRSMSEGD